MTRAREKVLLNTESLSFTNKERGQKMSLHVASRVTLGTTGPEVVWTSVEALKR